MGPLAFLAGHSVDVGLVGFDLLLASFQLSLEIVFFLEVLFQVVLELDESLSWGVPNCCTNVSFHVVLKIEIPFHKQC